MNRNRVIAGSLVITIVTGCVGIPSKTVAAQENNQKEKEEVIYIMTDADGKVDSINAVNIFGKGNVTDYGDYSSVKMLNTNDKIQQDGDKITFSTDKEKVYYQGTMKQTEIPWNISFTYLLDGKEIAPEDLAGQSGALEIHVKIDKNEACTTDFYDSCALQAAVTLDTEKCENIQADGATLANVGADKQISYTMLPGKGLDAVIKADVTDFEMDAITINGVKLDLGIDIDDDELMEKVTDIMDAAKKLNDGASELSDGTKDLADGSGSLKDGAASLYAGTTSLDSGITTLDQGVSQMLEALQTVQAELSSVSVATDQLKQLTDSSSAIHQGIGDAYAGAVTLSDNLSYSSYKSTMQQGGLNLDELQAGNTQAAENLTAQTEKLNTAVETLENMPDYNINPVYQKAVQILQSQIDASNQMAQLFQGNNAAIAGTEQYFNSLSAGSDEFVTGLGQLNDNYAEFDTAIVSLADTLSGLAGNVTELKDGIKTLANGSKQLVSGSKELKDGAVSLDNGVGTLSSGVQELKDGTQEFYDQTDGMDEKIEDTMDDMINSLFGGDAQITSFVSDKNTNVESVQFVIKTDAIEKKEVEEKTEEKTEKMSLGDKLLNLFGMGKDK